MGLWLGTMEAVCHGGLHVYKTPLASGNQEGEKRKRDDRRDIFREAFIKNYSFLDFALSRRHTLHFLFSSHKEKLIIIFALLILPT